MAIVNSDPKTGSICLRNPAATFGFGRWQILKTTDEVAKGGYKEFRLSCASDWATAVVANGGDRPFGFATPSNSGGWIIKG